MGIIVGDNFNYQSNKPLDSRAQFASLADMKAYPDASLYDGCIAYVTANKKNYQYDSNNTTDPDTGKWREFETGGGGGSVPAGGTTGQALLKASNADEDVTWGNPVDANAFHTDETTSDVVDDVSYFPYMYTAGQSFYKYRISWGNVKSKLKTYFDQYYSGGGSGTSNYNDLTNKPQIASVTLSGNTELSTLGLTSSVETQFSGSSTKSYVTRGEKYDWNTGNTVYGTCSTSASTTAKSVTVSRGTFNFTAGARIAIKFSYNNIASAPTLTVNSTTKNIKCIDETGSTYTPSIWWDANDIVEFIYDGTQFLMQPTTGMMFKIHGTTMDREDIYSTSEKVVGCWTDGRPLYQKTIDFGALPNATTKSVNHGASNVKDIISVTGWAWTGTSPKYYYNLPFSDGTETGGLTITLSASSTAIYMSCSTNQSAYSGYVTIKYTKTTDSANSFKYGDPNDYSTTEKIVGTWIDGKPLYQKTFHLNVPSTQTDGTAVHSLTSVGSSVDVFVSLEGIIRADNSTGNNVMVPTPRIATSNTSVSLSGFPNNYSTSSTDRNKIRVTNTGKVFNEDTIYVTIKYTKTTD